VVGSELRVEPVGLRFQTIFDAAAGEAVIDMFTPGLR
jgi:hypothetical protein